MYSDKITQNVALAVMKVMEEELSAKQKKIAVVAGDPKKIDAEDFKKLRKEDVVDEAKHEPAKPDAAAVLRRKKIQDIEDRKEKAKAAPSNVRKHEGSAYGGGKQKYDMDESMDAAKSLAQKGMKSEPGSMTSITRDKAGKVTSYQVTGPMKKSNTSDPMARARSLAQKGMKLPEEVEQVDEGAFSSGALKPTEKFKREAKKIQSTGTYVGKDPKGRVYTSKTVNGKEVSRTYEETTFSGLLASIHENGLTAIHEMFVRESASEEEFNAELKIAQEKSEGKGKKAEIAKGQVQAVKNEEVELDEAKQSEEDYHSESNFPLHHNLHMHNLKYLHDAHAFHGYARDTEDPENGGGRNGAAAKAVKNIDRHVREKYGHNAVKQLQHSGGPEGDVDNFKKTLAHAKEHAQLKKEETEVVEYELDVNAINGVKMETIDERSLTAAETEKKEDTVKSMKKSMSGFKERYGDRAKEVMYATATKQAMAMPKQGKKGY